MTVKELKQKLDKIDDDCVIVIEGEKGRKFHLITAKKRTLKAGHNNIGYCWMPTGKIVKCPLELEK